MRKPNATILCAIFSLMLVPKFALGAGTAEDQMRVLEDALGADGCVSFIQPIDQVNCESNGSFSSYTNVYCHLSVVISNPRRRAESLVLRTHGFDQSDIGTGEGKFWTFVLTLGIGTLVDEALISSKANAIATENMNRLYSTIVNSGGYLCAVPGT